MKIVIPARYASTRLPGKPLADIAGKPMVVRVWERAVEAIGMMGGDVSDIIIAADDARIIDAAERAGAIALMTRDDHASGTDRIAEVARKLGWRDSEVVVNVQGDEPLIPPAVIAEVGKALEARADMPMATAACPITDVAEAENPNAVKVVCSAGGKALYFSRAPIPFDRDGLWGGNVVDSPYKRHIGIYAYRAGTLAKLTALPPAPIEELEALEQLRALYNGLDIHVVSLDEAPPAGVDTPEDLEAVRRHFNHA